MLYLFRLIIVYLTALARTDRKASNFMTISGRPIAGTKDRRHWGKPASSQWPTPRIEPHTSEMLPETYRPTDHSAPLARSQVKWLLLRPWHRWGAHIGRQAMHVVLVVEWYHFDRALLSPEDVRTAAGTYCTWHDSTLWTYYDVCVDSTHKWPGQGGLDLSARECWPRRPVTWYWRCGGVPPLRSYSNSMPAKEE